MYGSYTPYGSTGATFHSDSRQVTSDQNQCPLCNERTNLKEMEELWIYLDCGFSTCQKLNNIFLPPLIQTSTSTVFYKYFCFSSSYKNSKNKIYISIGSVHKILLICHRCTWRWGRVFLTVHVISREALTAHKERVHGGHFGSDKRMYTVEDGC